MSDSHAWRQAFTHHLAATSPEPIGIVVERARGAHLYGPDGEVYLDLLAGIGVANVGHTHPAVVAAVEAQNRRHHHVMVYGEYVQEAPALYAAELAASAPAGLDRVFFVNSGAEAVEGALKLARKVTRRDGFVCFAGAYHGDTFGALSVAGNPRYQEPFGTLLGPVTVLPFGDAGALPAIDATVAAVIVEPVQGEGGVRVPPPGFLPALAARCRETGTLLVLDEVMTGFGRTGRGYACEHWGVVPDVLVLAKALGGGYPLGAFLARSEIMATLADDPPLSHVTTFGGHPVSTAAGRAALGVLQAERLAERADRVGEAWRGELRAALGDRAREVRGLGLLVGVEFAEAARAERVTRRCREEGILLGWTLHHDHILRLCPPLVIAEDDLARAVRVLADAARD